jgi:hypothetical protein
MRKHTVKIHGHHCEIRVDREGKHLWFAVGDYLGQENKNGLVINGHAVKQAAFTWPFANTPVNEG